jgi:hypothetical protein
MKRRMFVAATGAATGAAAGAAFGADRTPAAEVAATAAASVASVAYSGTWSGRPAAGSAGMGAEIAITDVPAGGVSRWVSDGSTWRTVSGCVLLYAQGKGYSDPLGSVTWGRAAVTMAIPGGSIKIPAGLIEPGLTELRVSVLWATGANTGGMAAQMTIGTSNSWSDTQCSGAFLGPDNEWDQVASFTFPTATSMTQASSLTPKNGAPVGAMGSEYVGNLNTAADMYINFGSTHGGVQGNVLKIVRAKVELFL